MKKRWTALLLLAVSAAALAYAVERSDIAPRQLALYLERRGVDSDSGVDQFAASVGARMAAFERGSNAAAALPRWTIGAQEASLSTPAEGKLVPVSTALQAAQAIAGARTGDVITFAPGSYRFDKVYAIEASSASGVTVRAERPGTVNLDFDLAEGILVSAPRWTFENLTIRGACSAHDRCEHAFHVVGGATGFVARNNTITDFNAHFKINSLNGKHPDQGSIDHNTLRNNSVRNTGNPVTVIDIVGANDWSIRANIIADFVKGKGNTTSYGAFAKGAGARTSFVGNIVICEHKLRGAAGQRIGLSLGNGGTGSPFCRDKRCITEQDGGVIESNLIASCSDEGIYLNRAATSSIRHNTLIDTAGIMLRYPETSADVSGNIVDGRIAVSQGALLRASDNLETTIARMYAGSHPLRDLFRAPEAFDFSWKEKAPQHAVAQGVADMCAGQRSKTPAYGAFEDFKNCLR
jgi:parallel beta-helix repeat protein